MAEFVQESYRLTLDQMAAGQIANAMTAKCESGIFKPESGDAQYIPFGTATQWIADNEVKAGIAYAPIGRLTSGAGNTGALAVGFLPGIPHPAVGSVVRVGSEEILVTSSSSTGAVNGTRGYNSTTAATHASNAEVFLLNSGPTTFAGVAVRNVSLPGDNSPVDSYNDKDHVTVGSEGDFVVQTVAAVNDGDRVSVYVGSTAANYGKFTNNAADGDHIAIPGAVFKHIDPRSTVSGTTTFLAVLRLPKQPT